MTAQQALVGSCLLALACLLFILTGMHAPPDAWAALLVMGGLAGLGLVPVAWEKLRD